MQDIPRNCLHMPHIFHTYIVLELSAYLKKTSCYKPVSLVIQLQIFLSSAEYSAESPKSPSQKVDKNFDEENSKTATTKIDTSIPHLTYYMCHINKRNV